MIVWTSELFTISNANIGNSDAKKTQYSLGPSDTTPVLAVNCDSGEWGGLTSDNDKHFLFAALIDSKKLVPKDINAIVCSDERTLIFQGFHLLELVKRLEQGEHWKTRVIASFLPQSHADRLIGMLFGVSM